MDGAHYFGDFSDDRSKEEMKQYYKNQRLVLAPKIIQAYKAGMSLRTIAAEIGKSYGFVHSVITQSDVQMRQRGGNNDTRTKKTNNT